MEISLYLSNFGRFEAFLWSLSVQEPYVSGVIELGVWIVVWFATKELQYSVEKTVCIIDSVRTKKLISTHEISVVKISLVSRSEDTETPFGRVR